MSKLTALMGVIVLSVSYAWAQTPAPAPAWGYGWIATAGDAAAGGISDHWRIIPVIIVVAAVIYFIRRGRRA
ncbi:hypothetical protein JKG68_07085 [Microvirga aerilata]|uniref:VPEID-CTERM sorting domain-containing protein n=1 Tax=Microvirga aerilata TaxID=670292 RepID=A0A937CWJ0_9HYPH|nr:hypothetical protein [Microvirga aerilata]MBL0403723.1 hypothetical protein [Microvirga aerilata]